MLLLQAGVSSSVLAARERMILGNELQNISPPTDPVFIIGHWRSGTTLLHQLLACDSALWAPTLFQCCYPHSFMTARQFVEPVLRAFLSATRPMDNVSLGMDEPQEEENALFRMTGYSPLERLIFARSEEYFLAGENTFLPKEAIRKKKWRDSFLFFAAKLSYATQRRLVFKNPFNILRVAELVDIFPEARFIYIYRDPYTVIQSTQRMWSITGRDNAMNPGWRAPSLEEVAQQYVRLETRLQESLQDVESSRTFKLSFEDLENYPIEQLRRLYSHWSWSFPDSLRQRIGKRVQAFGGYKKNCYSLSDCQRNAITSILTDHPVLRG
ncbi:MAG: sulfotransferase family protein [Fibrobacterota bacterium]